MLHSDLSMTLAAMRIRDLVAESERHALLKAARRDAVTSPWSVRVKNAPTRVKAWLQAAPREEGVRSAGTSAAVGAGPMGCSA